MTEESSAGTSRAAVRVGQAEGDPYSPTDPAVSNRRLDLSPNQVQRLGLASALVAIGIAASILSEHFLSLSNFANIGRAVSVIGIVSIGQMVVLLTENIDLSVGSTAAFAGVVMASTQGLGTVPSVGLALLAGAGIGLAHGYIRVWTGVSSLVITLATLTGIRGLVLVMTDGFPMTIESDFLTDLIWGDLLGIPRPLLIFGVALVGGSLVLKWTRFGTYIYAVGGNRSAAEKAGISSGRIIVAAFVVTGVCAAIAGIMIASRLGLASPTAGIGWELESIAAVVIGGASLSGGRGDMFGTMLGVLLIGVISNAMNLVGIDAFFQEIVLGLLILLAVVASARQERAAAEA